MIKKVIKKNVLYTIKWSKPFIFEKYTILGITAQPGIIQIFQEKESIKVSLLFYSCWKFGIRMGLRDIISPEPALFPKLLEYNDQEKLMFRYTVIDTNVLDLVDILYWLINEYEPEFNNAESFKDSARYRDIYMQELYERNTPEKTNSTRIL